MALANLIRRNVAPAKMPGMSQKELTKLARTNRAKYEQLQRRQAPAQNRAAVAAMENEAGRGQVSLFLLNVARFGVGIACAVNDEAACEVANAAMTRCNEVCTAIQDMNTAKADCVALVKELAADYAGDTGIEKALGFGFEMAAGFAVSILGEPEAPPATKPE